MKIVNAIFSIIALAMVLHIAGCTVKSDTPKQLLESEITQTSINTEISQEIIISDFEEGEVTEFTNSMRETEDYPPPPFEYTETPFFFIKDFYQPLGAIDYFPNEFHYSNYDRFDEEYSDFLSSLNDKARLNLEDENYIICRITEKWNLFNFVKNTNLNPSYVRVVLLSSSYSYGHDPYYFNLSEVQADALMSGDEEYVLKEFATEWCIVKGVNFYSGEWLHFNDTDAYEEAGLAAEEIFEILKLCRTLPGFDGEFLEKKLCLYAEKTGSSLTIEEICAYKRDIDMPQPYYNSRELSSEVAKFKRAFSNLTWKRNLQPYFPNDFLWYIPIGQNTKLNFDVTNENLEKLIGVRPFLEFDEKSRELLIAREKDVLNSGNAEKIIKYFSSDNDTVLIKGDRFYSFAWVYYNKPESYKSENLNPDELLAMLPKYEELDILTDEAMTALKNKLYTYKENYAQ